MKMMVWKSQVIYDQDWVAESLETGAVRRFKTWRRALAFANSKSSMVQVELEPLKYEMLIPPFEEDIKFRLKVNVYDYLFLEIPSTTITDKSYGNVEVYPQDYLPLARILLAAHYQKETQ